MAVASDIRGHPLKVPFCGEEEAKRIVAPLIEAVGVEPFQSELNYPPQRSRICCVRRLREWCRPGHGW
jgi:hypothetical protein